MDSTSEMERAVRGRIPRNDAPKDGNRSLANDGEWRGTTMVRNLLVATDGSNYAKKGIATACELATTYGATLHIVHVVEHYKIPESIREYIKGEEIEEEPGTLYMNVVGEKIIHEAEKQARDLGIANVKTALLRGSAADAIVKYAEEHEVDMIVMGTHGLGFIEGLIMGSVSRKVCNTAACSCMTVR